MPGTEVRDTRSTAMKPLAPVVIPTFSNPMSVVLGTEPTVINACEPRISRPSVSVATTSSPSRTTDSARARLHRIPPRSANTSSITAAASASSPGSTRSRLEINVTGTPISM